MIAIIGLIPTYAFWGPNIIWKLFDLFIGLIQAFIFALLTVIYFGMAGETDDAHGDTHDDAHGETDSHADTARSSDSSESDAPSAQPELSGAR